MGVRERFLTPTIGGAPSVAVLSTPVGATRPLGWVLCQSFGPEQDLLAGLEVPVVRALAAAGFPVLRFFARGYGDSQVSADHVSLRTHLEDTLEAVELLRGLVPIREVGLAGAYFGGTIAAMAADRLDDRLPATALALWEPAVRGRDYMRTILRLGMMTELIGHGRNEATADPAEILREKGMLDVQGFPLRAAVYDEIMELNIAKDLRAFAGSALVVQVSKSARVRPDMQNLADRLTELGATVQLDVVQRPDAHKLRRPRFKGRGDGTKVDTQQGLVTDLLEKTLSWSQELPGGAE